MKKLLSFVLALALALSLSVTAFAAGDEDTGTTTQNTTIQPGTNGEPSPSSGDTQVNYSVAPAYTVTIPASVTIDGTNNSNTVTVKAENVRLAKGEQMVVRLTGINETTDESGTTTSGDKFTVKTAEGAELEYTVKIDQTEVTTANDENTVLTVDPASTNEQKVASGSQSLTFALATGEVVKYAGEYSGTVTFTVSVEEVPDTTGGNNENP